MNQNKPKPIRENEKAKKQKDKRFIWYMSWKGKIFNNITSRLSQIHNIADESETLLAAHYPLLTQGTNGNVEHGLTEKTHFLLDIR